MTARTPGDYREPGSGAAYGEVKGRCAKCHNGVRITVETDGDGGLVDVVEPCQTCTGPAIRIVARSQAPLTDAQRLENHRRWSRERARRQSAANPFSTRVCKTCGEPFQWRRKPGRPAYYCDNCR